LIKCFHEKYLLKLLLGEIGVIIAMFLSEGKKNLRLPRRGELIILGVTPEVKDFEG